MEKEKATQRAAQLRAEIEQHNALYYQHAKPEISDAQFDVLLRELQEIERANPELITPDSPTQRVGGTPLEGFTQIEHRVRMMSLDNTYSESELVEFYTRLQKGLSKERIRCTVEPKVDGVAVSVRYENGTLKYAATRGDGRMGDDITQNMKTIRALPLRLPKQVPQTFEVRGEVYMTRANFDKLNAVREEAGEPLFANPRNTTAGTLKQLDPRDVAKRPLHVIFYGIGDLGDAPLESQTAIFQLLHDAGLPTAEHIWHCETAEEILSAIRELDVKRKKLPYDTDGAVVKVDAFIEQRELGVTSKAPRWAIAYKYAPEQAETRLRAIDIQVGRTGVLTPVARLDTTVVSGSAVSNATLHNLQEILRKDVRIGDKVVIQKAGEIIPEVVGFVMEPDHDARPRYKFPLTCPICNTPVVHDSVFIRCPNDECPAVVKRRVEHFTLRGAMDIRRLGEQVVAQLVDAQLVRNVADLYDLNELSIAQLERQGTKSIENLLKGLVESKQQPPWRLVFGLGILHVGSSSARSLLDYFGSVDTLAAAEVIDLLKVQDIGEIVAQSLHAWFRDERNVALLTRLRDAGLLFSNPQFERASDKFASTTWVITGTLSQPREEIADVIRANGGKVSLSISAKTNYLLAGEEAGSKLDKAAKLGVKVLNEAAFREML